jgi:Family of unknown function (DUF5681)
METASMADFNARCLLGEIFQYEEDASSLTSARATEGKQRKKGHNHDQGWQPGQSGNPAGRPKGSKNKFPMALKESILSAFQKLGGDDYLVALGKENSSAFSSLLGKILPLRHAIDAHSGGGNDRTIVFVRHIVHADGRREIEGVTPKQLPAPASPALPRPTDPTDDTNEGAV